LREDFGGFDVRGTILREKLGMGVEVEEDLGWAGSLNWAMKVGMHCVRCREGILNSLVGVGVENKTSDIVFDDMASEMMLEDIASKMMVEDMDSEGKVEIK
jgi:hypothetical protein